MIGSGPAGFYAAGHLLKDADAGFEVDMIDYSNPLEGMKNYLTLARDALARGDAEAADRARGEPAPRSGEPAAHTGDTWSPTRVSARRRSGGRHGPRL